MRDEAGTRADRRPALCALSCPEALGLVSGCRECEETSSVCYGGQVQRSLAGAPIPAFKSNTLHAAIGTCMHRFRHYVEDGAESTNIHIVTATGHSL